MDTAHEYAQQELVRGIVSALHRAVPDDHIPAFVDLAQILVARTAEIPTTLDRDLLGHTLFADLVEPSITVVTTIPEEQAFLYGQLTQAVMQSVYAQANFRWMAYDLRRQMAATTAA